MRRGHRRAHRAVAPLLAVALALILAVAFAIRPDRSALPPPEKLSSAFTGVAA